MNGDVIHQEPLEIGGDTVESLVPEDHIGACSVVSASGSEKFICAFPTLAEACRAAWYATTPDGGYGSVIIRSCSIDEVTHDTFEDWAF